MTLNPMAGPPDSDPTDQKLAAALAHPLRAQILEIVGKEEASPAALRGRLERPAAVISYHASVLRESGCIELTRAESREGTIECFYRASAPAESGGRDSSGQG
jgi:DNA-binding transcriptional ArsR family regulator